MSEQPPQYPAQPPQGPGQPPQSPPQNPYQPYGGSGPTGPPNWKPEHPQATMVLILGILGMAVCQLIAPFAWVIGRRVKKEIDESGGQYAGSSQVQVGYILGIVGTCLMIVGVLFFVVYIVIVVIAIGASATA